MIPMYEGGKLQNEVKAGWRASYRRTKLWFITKIGLTKVLKPNLATVHNARTFTGKGKKKAKRCSTNMFASYYHYFGGNAQVVDKTFQVKGTPGLFVSDGSVMPRLTPGPSSASIMQTGMRVADAVAAAFDGPNE